MTRGATALVAKPGSRSSALAMNSRTASEATMSVTGAAEEGQAIGGTGQHSSPGTPSTVRLVTTMRSSGTATSRRLTSAATSSRRCSAPSITTRRGVVDRAASTDAMTSTPGWSRRRRQDATAEVSDSGWRTGSSGMTNVCVQIGEAHDRLQREPGLADPARPGDADQPRPPPQRRVQLRELGFAPDETGMRDRQRSRQAGWPWPGPRTRPGRAAPGPTSGCARPPSG